MPVELREKLTIPEARWRPATLTELLTRFGGEAVMLSTCNRVEVYLVDSSAVRSGGVSYVRWHRSRCFRQMVPARQRGGRAAPTSGVGSVSTSLSSAKGK